MLLGPVRTHLTTWAGNSDCIAKINSRGEMRAGAGLGKLGGWWEWRVGASAANRLIGDVVQSWRRPLLGPSPG